MLQLLPGESLFALLVRIKRPRNLHLHCFFDQRRKILCQEWEKRVVAAASFDSPAEMLIWSWPFGRHLKRPSANRRMQKHVVKFWEKRHSNKLMSGAAERALAPKKMKSWMEKMGGGKVVVKRRMTMIKRKMKKGVMLWNGVDLYLRGAMPGWMVCRLCLPLSQTLSFLYASLSFTCLSVILLKGLVSVRCFDLRSTLLLITPCLILRLEEGCCEWIRTFFLPFKPPSPPLVSFLFSALPISLSPRVLLSCLVLPNVIVRIIIY